MESDIDMMALLEEIGASPTSSGYATSPGESGIAMSPSSTAMSPSSTAMSPSSSSNDESDATNGRTCKVCGLATATRHVHYGTSAACHSCRAFFRRSVQSGNYAKFACRGLGGSGVMCETKSKSWKSCQWCRFQKCLAAGMKPSWVLTERDRRMRYSKQNGTVNSKAMATVSRPMEIGFSSDDFLRLRQLFKTFQQTDCMSCISYLGGLDSEMYKNKTLQWAHHGGCYDQEMIDMLIDMSNLSISKFMKGRIISTGDNILDSDYERLASHNLANVRAAFNGFCSLVGEHKDFITKYMDDYEASLKELAPLNKGIADMYEVAKDPVFKERIATESYDLFFASPWAADEGLEQRHRELSKVMSRWMYEEVPQAGDVEIKYLLIMVILFLSTDFVEGLVDEAAVRRKQESYCHLLYKYLKFKVGPEPGRAEAALGQAMLLGAHARELKEIEDKRLKI